MWNRDSHTAAFGAEPARFAFRFADETPIVVNGEGQPLPESGNLTIGVNQTVTIGVTVENVGGTVGDYEFPFQVGDTNATRTGRLEPGETATHRFDRRFTDPGSYRIDVGGETVYITVSENARPAESTDDEPTRIELPGFGITAAAVAGRLVLSLGVARR